MQHVGKASLGETAKRGVLVSRAAEAYPSVCLTHMAVPVPLGGVEYNATQVCLLAIDLLQHGDTAILTRVVNMIKWME